MAVKVRQHKGKYWVFIDHKGKRKAKCIGTSKRTAEVAADRIEAKLTLGDFSLLEEKPQRPFDAYFRNWLDTYVKANCKERTYEVYAQALRCHLLSHFGQKDITAITREEVKRLAYGLLAQGKSRNTVMITLAPLREMFNHAIEDRHVTVNPALGVMRLARKGKGERQEKVTFLTREEIPVLLETCWKHAPDYAPLVLLLVRTGLRIGEACAVQWDDLDFINRFIEVRRTYSNGRIDTPKSSTGRRVDMSLQLTDALKTVLLDRKKETLRKGWGDVPPWIFLREDGSCLTPNYVRMRVWPKLSAKTGLRYVRIHDLRHTFASLLIQNGESLAYVKEQLGHHSIQITVDTYGHLIPGGNKAAVDRLDDPVPATIRNLSATTPQDATGKRLQSA